MISLNPIKLAYATMIDMSKFKFLILVKLYVMTVGKMSFLIGKRMALVAEKNVLLLWSRSFICSGSKKASEYLWSMYQ